MSEPLRRILVTGACGYLAGRIIGRLENIPGVDYILAVDIRPPLKEFSSNKIEFHTLDVREPFPDILREHRIESVIHLAYVMNPGHDRRAAWRVNVQGTANLLDACSNSGVQQICYLSSTSVYGAHPDNPEFLTEDSPVRPIRGFQYSEDKAEVETLLTEYAGSHPEVAVTVLRVCPVLGPNADNFIAAAFSKPFLVAVRGYDPPMQFIHEDDLVDNFLSCLKAKPSGTFNLAGGGTIRWSEMARIFGRRLLNLPAPVRSYGHRLGAAASARLAAVRHRLHQAQVDGQHSKGAARPGIDLSILVPRGVGVVCDGRVGLSHTSR